MEKYPAIRRAQANAVVEDGAQMVLLSANDGLLERSAMVSLPAYYLITLMDGKSTLAQICDKFHSQFRVKVAEKDVEGLVEQLDEAFLLDNHRYANERETILREFNSQPLRPMAHAGISYPAEPASLASILQESLADIPMGQEWAESVIVPHIDFRVGSGMMAEGWRQIPARPDELVIILGTGHYLAEDFFSCIDKDYRTPLGNMRVDRGFLAALKDNFGEDIFANAFAHKNEHSIEFQSLFMSYRNAHNPGLSCVPILLSFPENIWSLDDPIFNGDRLDHFIAALKKTAGECGKKIRYVASVDLAHIGARFGDEEPLSADWLKRVEREDMELIETFQTPAPQLFLERISRMNHQNRVCGFPPLYLLSQLSKARIGKLLGYRQNVEGEMENMVSFATMALYE